MHGRRLWTTEEGTFGVEKLPCARTYHINVLLRVKSLARGAPERAMVMQRCVALLLAGSGECMHILSCIVMKQLLLCAHSCT